MMMFGNNGCNFMLTADCALAWPDRSDVQGCKHQHLWLYAMHGVYQQYLFFVPTTAELVCLAWPGMVPYSGQAMTFLASKTWC